MDTQDIQDNISLGFAIILYILSIHVKFLLVAAMLRYVLCGCKQKGTGYYPVPSV